MKNPIGIFDSGIGGISILEKLKQLLPNENLSISQIIKIALMEVSLKKR